MSRLPRTPPSYREVLTSFPAHRPVPLTLNAKWPAGPMPLSRDRIEALAAEAHDGRARHMRAVIAGIARPFAAFLRAAMTLFHDWRRRRREREELARLDDRALRDMGLSRYDVIMAGRRSRQDRS